MNTNGNNKFIQIYGHRSPLMSIMFDLLLNAREAANESSDILNTISSCQAIYEKCDIFINSINLF